MEFKKLQETLGYTFKNEKLLKTALTHTSYAHEKNTVSYERLEFLGDAILQMLTSRYIYDKYPDFPEGKMSRLRSNIVCEETLCTIAKKLKIGEYALFGHGEEMTGGRERASVLADMVEAILAAIYLDGGLDVAREIIFDAYGHIIESAARGEMNRDYKTELQEILQKDGTVDIHYELVGEDGPAHMKVFEMRVMLSGRELGRGCGRSKQEAQQNAAKKAIGEIRGEN